MRPKQELEYKQCPVERGNRDTGGVATLADTHTDTVKESEGGRSRTEGETRAEKNTKNQQRTYENIGILDLKV